MRSATAVGTPIASTASTASSAATASRHARKAVTLTVAEASTGPATVAPGGRSRASRRCVAEPSVATVSPVSTHASAASTPAPPALETIATRRPPGSGWHDQERCRLDQLAQAVGGDDARLAEQRLLRHQRRGRGGRVRRRRPLPGCRPAADDGEHGQLAADAARSPREAARIAEGLHVVQVGGYSSAPTE